MISIKTLHTILCSLLAMLLVAGCTADPVQPEGQGTLRLQLAQVSTQTVTRTTPKELGAPVQELFHLKAVSQSNGNTAYDGDFVSELTLPTGAYEITATCGEDVAIGRDAPFYTGAASVTIKDGQQSTALIGCRVGNALVSAVFGRDETERARFDKHYSAYGLMIGVGGHSLPITSDDDAASIYFPAGSTVSLTFFGTLRNGEGCEVSMPLTHESIPAVFQAADHAIVTLTLPDPENILNVNIGKVEMESVTIEESIPLSWLPISKAVGTHTYDEAGNLLGTDLMFTNSYPDMEWKAVVTNEQGEEVRTVSGTGPLSSTYDTSADWPFLPAGKYKATYYLLEDGKANRTGSREFMIGNPELTVTLGGYTSHTRYIDGATNEANTLDGKTIYAPQASVNISNQLAAHSRYGFKMNVTFEGESQQTSAPTLQMDNRSEAPRLEPYTLSATADFAGIHIEGSRQLPVSGLPLRSAPPTEGQGWAAESDYVTWGATEVRLGNRGGWLTHNNESIVYKDIAISAGTKLTVDYNISIAVYVVGTTFSCNIDEGSIFSHTDQGSYQGPVSYTNQKSVTYVQCHNSYGGGSTYTDIFSLNLIYGQ